MIAKKSLIQEAKSQMNIIKMSADLIIGTVETCDIIGLCELLKVEKVTFTEKGLQFEDSVEHIIQYLVTETKKRSSLLESLDHCLDLSFRQDCYLVYFFIIEVFYILENDQKIADALLRTVCEKSTKKDQGSLHRYFLTYNLDPKFIVDAFEVCIRIATKEPNLETVVSDLRNYLKSYPNV